MILRASTDMLVNSFPAVSIPERKKTHLLKVRHLERTSDYNTLLGL
jgi:hypothetical protein